MRYLVMCDLTVPAFLFSYCHNCSWVVPNRGLRIFAFFFSVGMLSNSVLCDGEVAIAILTFRNLVEHFAMHLTYDLMSHLTLLACPRIYSFSSRNIPVILRNPLMHCCVLILGYFVVGIRFSRSIQPPLPAHILHKLPCMN